MNNSAEQIDPNFDILMEQLGATTEREICWKICSVYKKLPKQLREQIAQYYTMYPFWGKLAPKKLVYETFYKRANVLKERYDDFVWLREKLADVRSKNVLYAIMSNWFEFNFNSLVQYKETEHPEYFDPNIFPRRPDEVLVDAGAYTGDTVYVFVNTYGSYKRIYCYEITPDVFDAMKNNLSVLQNVELRQKAVGSEPGVLYLSESSHNSANITSTQGEIAVDVVRVDDDISEPVSFIKMDIEGAEQAALLGCAEQIRKNHPHLAICTYHSYEDIIEIPRLIDEIAPGYKFYMRHHGGNLVPTEFTLLAVWEGIPPA